MSHEVADPPIREIVKSLVLNFVKDDADHADDLAEVEAGD